MKYFMQFFQQESSKKLIVPYASLNGDSSLWWLVLASDTSSASHRVASELHLFLETCLHTNSQSNTEAVCADHTFMHFSPSLNRSTLKALFFPNINYGLLLVWKKLDFCSFLNHDQSNRFWKAVTWANESYWSDLHGSILQRSMAVSPSNCTAIVLGSSRDVYAARLSDVQPRALDWLQHPR